MRKQYLPESKKWLPVLGFASAAGFRDIDRRFLLAIYETPG
jgi:hypothetical protein